MNLNERLEEQKKVTELKKDRLRRGHPNEILKRLNQDLSEAKKELLSI